MRCIQCRAAPCTVACPVDNDIPGSLWLLEQGDFDGAANVFRETSELPEMCGRLCPQERLCEGDCVVGKKGIPVAIGKLEAFVTEHQRTHGDGPSTETAPATGKTVAVIGAGPAGIGVAERLARNGHAVTMYDAWPIPGALLHYGIPNFKQNKATVAHKFDDLRAMGVELVMNTRIGEDVPFEDLERDHDAVFIGVGAIAGSRLGFEHEDAQACTRPRTSSCAATCRQRSCRSTSASPCRPCAAWWSSAAATPRWTASAPPCGSAPRQVRLVYRRTEEEMQGRSEERQHAYEEGVIFDYVTAPLAILTDADGAVSGRPVPAHAARRARRVRPRAARARARHGVRDRRRRPRGRHRLQR